MKKLYSALALLSLFATLHVSAALVPHQAGDIVSADEQARISRELGAILEEGDRHERLKQEVSKVHAKHTERDLDGLLSRENKLMFVTRLERTTNTMTSACARGGGIDLEKAQELAKEWNKLRAILTPTKVEPHWNSKEAEHSAPLRTAFHYTEYMRAINGKYGLPTLTAPWALFTPQLGENKECVVAEHINVSPDKRSRCNATLQELERLQELQGQPSRYLDIAVAAKRVHFIASGLKYITEATTPHPEVAEAVGEGTALDSYVDDLVLLSIRAEDSKGDPEYFKEKVQPLIEKVTNTDVEGNSFANYVRAIEHETDTVVGLSLFKALHTNKLIGEILQWQNAASLINLNAQKAERAVTMLNLCLAGKTSKLKRLHAQQQKQEAPRAKGSSWSGVWDTVTATARKAQELGQAALDSLQNQAHKGGRRTPTEVLDADDFELLDEEA